MPAFWPAFYFRIREMGPDRDRRMRTNTLGHWHPPTELGHNVILRRGPIQHLYWACDRADMQPRDDIPRTARAAHFRTYSVYYHHGAFYVVDYDATRHPVGDAPSPTHDSPSASSSRRQRRNDAEYMGWQRMRFRGGPPTQFATVAGNDDQLHAMNTNSAWPRRLFPSTQHPHPYRESASASMNGELPLLLALIVLAHPRQNADWVLRTCFAGGRWHLGQSGVWEDFRGVVVDVWAAPPYSSREDLEAFERGAAGNIFD